MEDFLIYINDWLESGQYTFFTSLTAHAVKSAILMKIQFLKMMIPFGWGVAKEVLTQLNVSDHIQSAWIILPTDIRTILTFFNVPEFINTVLTGFATRLVLKMLRVI